MVLPLLVNLLEDLLSRNEISLLLPDDSQRYINVNVVTLEGWRALFLVPDGHLLLSLLNYPKVRFTTMECFVYMLCCSFGGSFSIFLYLTGVHFREALQHGGDVSQQKIKWRTIRTREIGGVSLSDVLYECHRNYS